ncbi:MAG: DUF4339 domain-containing protein [Coriobacteriia bacterium]
MSEDWHYLENGTQRGPVSGASLKAMLDAGAIPADSPAWRDGMGDWIPASAALAREDFTPPAPAAPQAVRSKTNGWLIAWQISTLMFLVPTVFTLNLGIVGRERMLWPMIVCAASAIFVIAMFWRKKWALYGFVGMGVMQLALSIALFVEVTRGGDIGLAVLLMIPAIPYIVSAALLAAALRLGGKDVGWSSFS